jgi:xylose dehydrogenase (NAD/NADP)
MASGEPVRWGILGTGNINRKLLAGARQSEHLEVIAVGSRTVERARAHASEHRIPRAHGSYDELLEDGDVEAVYISLPNSLHHPWTLRALEAGKHVLCEKPYTRRSVEVDQAFDLAERSRLHLMEGFMWRHSPQTRRLLELLPEIGTLVTVRATFSWRLEDRTDIRVLPELDAGSLMDVGCYCVSGARLLAGAEPDRVYGESVRDENGTDWLFTGVLRFPSGVTAEFTSGFTTDHMGLEAIGSHGTIMLPDPWHATAGILIHDGREVRIDPTNPYRLELEDLSAAIRDGRRPSLGRRDALGQARTIEALYESAATTTSVTLPGGAASRA